MEYMLSNHNFLSISSLMFFNPLFIFYCLANKTYKLSPSLSFWMTPNFSVLLEFD